jgi:IclR family transcriptional regulator, acetate operon repressor
MSRYQVPAVVASSRILAVLASANGQGLRAVDLVRATGISKSTMHNLLATLESERFVQSDENQCYRLGPALVSLGAIAMRQRTAMAIAAERIRRLAREHELSFAVVQWIPGSGAGESEVVERAFPHGVHVGITLGSRYGPFDGALGKCLLAALPPAEATRVLRSAKLVAHTSRTITDPRTLLAEIEAVRNRGWAASIGEYNSNNAVTAPVFAPEGHIDLLLLSLGFPDQLTEEEVPRIGALLRDLGAEITQQAGGRPPAHWRALRSAETDNQAEEERWSKSTSS